MSDMVLENVRLLSHGNHFFGGDIDDQLVIDLSNSLTLSSYHRAEDEAIRYQLLPRSLDEHWLVVEIHR